MKGEPQANVTLSAVVGLGAVLQQTPLLYIYSVVDPPLVAEKAVISDTAAVVITKFGVVKLTSFP